ncbi:outer membrane beta-barrel protein [Bacteroides sp. 51]|uniref:outer membrane beta-barrel protein n=1 Tax=Bacteroides sp. 51 TaxID=2302938 RepID=UPI0013CF6E88|nr:outer membrane beta-barrel protein [Bacteroides sp. 51]NDV83398.1 hypothetical protein [Bacteroides sp. 51]
MKKAHISILLFLFSSIHLEAQTINGSLCTHSMRPIDGASIVLQKANSTYIDVAISDSKGQFTFASAERPYRLIIQHLVYETKLLIDSVADLGNIILEDNVQSMGEVIVLADAPVLTIAKNGALSYNVNNLIRNKPVGNALDILDEIPSVQKTGNSYSIIGTAATSIILNGRRSTMTTEQLKELLSTTDPARVKMVEIFYNTPPQYGVKGASINVVMEMPRTHTLQTKGSVHTALYQGKHFYPVGGGGLAFSDKSWAFDLNYALGKVKKSTSLDLDSRHTLNGKLHPIMLSSTTQPDKFSQRLTASFNIDLKNGDVFSVFYSGRFNDDKQMTATSMSENGDVATNSRNEENGNSSLHLFNADYTHKNFNVGADYTFYKQDNKQDLVDSDNTINVDILSSKSDQKVKRFNAYASLEHTIAKAVFTYGVDAMFSTSENLQFTDRNDGKTDSNNFSLQQKETDVDVYVSWKQKLGEKLSFSSTVYLQYFKSSAESGSDRTTLWEEFKCLPELSLVYAVKKGERLQLTFSSENNYPTYAQTTPRRLYYNTYLMRDGNPLLIPGQLYELSLNYIFGGKYSVGLYYNTKPKKIEQQLYQDPNSLTAIYKYINWDKDMNWGITGAFPFKWNDYFSTRLTADVYLSKQKGHVEDVFFDKQNMGGVGTLSNTVILNKAKTLSFQLSATYQSSMFSGYQENAESANISAGLTWKPHGSGWNLTLRGSDMFNTLRVKAETSKSSQLFRMTNFRDTRMAVFTARYTFGGYKEKRSHVDASRIGL